MSGMRRAPRPSHGPAAIASSPWSVVFAGVVVMVVLLFVALGAYRGRSPARDDGPPPAVGPTAASSSARPSTRVPQRPPAVSGRYRVVQSFDGGFIDEVLIVNSSGVHHDLDGLAGGTRIEYRAVVRDGRGRTATARSVAVVGTPELGGSREWAVVHYQRPAGGYDDWGLYAWGDIDPAYVTEWPPG
jgi:hypothetical protein